MSDVSTIEEATSMATDFLERMRLSGQPELKLHTDLTREHDFGSVYFWGPVDPQAFVGGNAPIIVSR